jgi:cell pole-organizing protein PopZ
MKTDTLTAEPSMDEILASIRQIISSNACKENKPLDEQDEEDILDLTHVLPEEESFTPPFGKSQEKLVLIDGKKDPHQKKSSSTLDDILGSFEDVVSPQIKSHFEDPLLSQKAVKETVQAFSSLHKVPPQKAPSLEERLSGQTIESLVREMLKPLLKEWLDENLPVLVRWVVNEQVEKVLQQREKLK